jgi:hypothetical protein
VRGARDEKVAPDLRGKAGGGGGPAKKVLQAGRCGKAARERCRPWAAEAGGPAGGGCGAQEMWSAAVFFLVSGDPRPFLTPHLRRRSSSSLRSYRKIAVGSRSESTVGTGARKLATPLPRCLMCFQLLVNTFSCVESFILRFSCGLNEQCKGNFLIWYVLALVCMWN